MTGRWRSRLIKLTALVVFSYLGLVLANVVLRLVPGDARSSRHERNIVAAEAAGIPFDTRTGWEVIEALRADGRPAYPFVTPPHFLRGDLEPLIEGGETILPLGGISEVATVACNETGTWMVYDADEHGFNNPPGLYDAPPAIVAVGDSFTHGTCMSRGDEFASHLRDELGPTLTLGTYGSGPVLMLAQIREYAARLRPPLVLWFYFEGNDVTTDVGREMADPILRRYLEPGFSQHLYDRQPTIDRLITAQIQPPADPASASGPTWPRATLAALTLSDVRVVAAKAIGRTLRFAAFRSLWFDDKYEEPLRQFDAALTRARDEVHGWGGELVFVYLPSWEAFHAPWHDGVVLKPVVLDLVAAHDIPIIDIEPSFRALPDPADAFALGLPNHYGATGNRLVADTILREREKGTFRFIFEFFCAEPGDACPGEPDLRTDPRRRAVGAAAAARKAECPLFRCIMDDVMTLDRPESTSGAGGWIASAKPAFTTLSPDRETVLSFDLEGRPISWFDDGKTYKRSLASVVHGRERVAGERRRFVVDDVDAATLFARLLDRVRAAPRDRLSEAVRARIDGILRWTPETLLAERTRFEAAYSPISILPPDQYLAIVVQATHGCTWNRCTFCNFYQDRPFETRSAEVLTDHLRRVTDLLGEAAAMRRRLFLADGNALALSIDRLRPIVDAARAAFPDRPWSGFVDVFTGERKSVDDWRALRDLGLDQVYVGLETGHGPLLTFLNKPGTPDEAGSFIRVLKEAGVRVSVILMAGAGGDRYADGHVRDTLALVGGLPLGPGDLVYLSPFVEHAGSEYARRARVEGIRALAPDERDAQATALRDALRTALPGVQVARYDIREFVY